jgi:ABC-type nickel/cobalt efflux system permease component RcnA
MCGDMDDDESEMEERLYARFRAHAQELLADQAPQEPADLSQYLDKLFSDALSRSVRDGEQADAAQRYERLAMQPLVFARLAGFLAGHLALSEDPLRKVIEAMMMGYGEAEALDQAQRHDHDHHHGDVPAHDHHH